MPEILDSNATYVSIATAHSAFNVFCTIILFPMGGILEKLVVRLVPDGKESGPVVELDERLLATPPIALERCHSLVVEMMDASLSALRGGIKSLREYTPELAEEICAGEEKTDHYEDILGTYLVKLSSRQISAADSAEAAKLLRMIGDFERISDHGVNLLKSAEEMHDKKLKFSDKAENEMEVISHAIHDVLKITMLSFAEQDLELAKQVEPLE